MYKLDKKLGCFCLLLFLMSTQFVRGQQTFGNNFIFEVIRTERKTMVKQPYVLSVSDTALYQLYPRLKNDSVFSHSAPKSPILLGVKLNPKLQHFFSGPVYAQTKEYPVYLISDSSDAILVAMGIDQANRSKYVYRVVENDSVELVKWSPIAQMEQKYGAKQPYAFLGKYNYPGKRIMVEVAHQANYSLRDGVLFDWRSNYRPILQQIVVSTPKSYFNLQNVHLNKGYATQFDENKQPKNFRFPVDSVTNLLFQFKKEETLVHAAWLIRTIEGKKDTLKLGFLDTHGYQSLDANYFRQPGYYELVVQQQQKVPSWNEANLVRITFEVFDLPLGKGVLLKAVGPYFVGLLLLFGVLFLSYRQIQRLKLQSINRQKIQAQLQLKTISAQLNPHFIFNALSSIQNLMNKDELLQANLYLSKFADLTRKVLVTSEQEMISLAEELKIAEDYLQLEQLRFGFAYQVNYDATLDMEHIEVPAVLLQPFIENAVKHGVAKLKQEGTISIEVQRENQDLLFTINDNGKGFQFQKGLSKEGAFGLKLGKQRLELLNQVYKTRLASLAIDSGPAGTTVILKFKNWIAHGN